MTTTGITPESATREERAPKVDLDWDSFTLAMCNHISYRNAPDRRRERLDRVQKRQRLAA